MRAPSWVTGILHPHKTDGVRGLSKFIEVRLSLMIVTNIPEHP